MKQTIVTRKNPDSAKEMPRHLQKIKFKAKPKHGCQHRSFPSNKVQCYCHYMLLKPMSSPKYLQCVKESCCRPEKNSLLGKRCNYSFFRPFSLPVLVPCKCIQDLVLAQCRVCQAGVSGLNKRVQPLISVLSSRWHGKVLPKTPTHHCQWHIPPDSSTSRLGEDTWHLHLGTGCSGPSMLPWGCKPPAQTGLICKHRIHEPLVPLAQLEPSSKPKQMLQDISSDAGCSLTAFKEPLEMA